MSHTTKFSTVPWEQQSSAPPEYNTRTDKEVEHILPKNKIPHSPMVDDALRSLCNTLPQQWAASIICKLVDNMIIDVDCVYKCSCSELQGIGIPLGAAKILTTGASELIKKKKQEELEEPLSNDESCPSPAVSEDGTANSDKKMHSPMAMIQNERVQLISPAAVRPPHPVSSNVMPFSTASSPTGTAGMTTPTAMIPYADDDEDFEECDSIFREIKDNLNDKFKDTRPLCKWYKEGWECRHHAFGNCHFYHPENYAEYAEYLEYLNNQKKELPFKFGVCHRCTDGEYCESGYAHTPEDVANYPVCKYKDNCCHVRKWKDGSYRRTNAVICMRYHGKETKEDLFERIQKNIKWTKWSSTA